MRHLLLCALAVLLLGLAPKSQPSAAVSLDPRQWLIHDGAWTPVTHPKPLTGMAGWYFDVPDASDSVNYVMVPYTTAMRPSQSVSFTAQIVVTSGTPVFNYRLEPGNTCEYPAHARAHFARTAPTNRKAFEDEIYAPDNFRWWANPTAMVLEAGTATVTVPLDPAQWSDTNGTFGDVDPIGFAAALAAPGTIGLTFGGGCFFGHGVNVSGGTARFLLTSYTVQ